MGVRILEVGLVVPGCCAAFLNNQKLIPTLHKELELEYCI